MLRLSYITASCKSTIRLSQQAYADFLIYERNYKGGIGDLQFYRIEKYRGRRWLDVVEQIFHLDEQGFFMRRGEEFFELFEFITIEF